MGSIDRNGQISRKSNGRGTRLVDVYTDGDVVAIPLRTKPLEGLDCMPEKKLKEYVVFYQTALLNAGKFGGPADGTNSEAWVAALKELQQANGLSVTGTLDGPTILTMEKDASLNPNSEVTVSVTASNWPDRSSSRTIRNTCAALRRPMKGTRINPNTSAAR